MANGRPEPSAQALELERILTWHWGKILKQVMLDAGIDNIELANLAKTTTSSIGKLRNGSLSQRNYIKVIRSLPVATRKEYLEKVFFGEIPEKLPKDVREKFDKKAERQRKKARSDREGN